MRNFVKNLLPQNAGIEFCHKIKQKQHILRGYLCESLLSSFESYTHFITKDFSSQSAQRQQVLLMVYGLIESCSFHVCICLAKVSLSFWFVIILICCHFIEFVSFLLLSVHEIVLNICIAGTEYCVSPTHWCVPNTVLLVLSWVLWKKSIGKVPRWDSTPCLKLPGNLGDLVIRYLL